MKATRRIVIMSIIGMMLRWRISSPSGTRATALRMIRRASRCVNDIYSHPEASVEGARAERTENGVLPRRGGAPRSGQDREAGGVIRHPEASAEGARAERTENDVQPRRGCAPRSGQDREAGRVIRHPEASAEG